jgi:hypothetical protein
LNSIIAQYEQWDDWNALDRETELPITALRQKHAKKCYRVPDLIRLNKTTPAK